jgi:ABC-type uncharacterized transport system permease subunit
MNAFTPTNKIPSCTVWVVLGDFHTQIFKNFTRNFIGLFTYQQVKDAPWDSSSVVIESSFWLQG